MVSVMYQMEKKDGEFDTTIPSTSDASVKVKASLLSAGSIECCLVYELVNQRNEHEPIMRQYQVFIAIRVSKTFRKKHSASAIMFMAKKGRFTGNENDINQLCRKILQKPFISDNYTFECTIKRQTMRLKAVFRSDEQVSIEVTLEKTGKRVNHGPVLFEWINLSK
jgi:hypothetical protein